MRVLFINPPRENEIIGNNPRIIDEERGYNPPLGILYVAAYLLEHSQHHVKVIDSQVEELSHNDLKARIEAYRPDVVGLTAMTMTIIDVLNVVRLVKKIDPSTLVVLGGPHISIYAEETISLKEVDYVVLGEGEQAFNTLLDAMGDEDKLLQIQGVLYKRNGKIIRIGPPSVIKDLDSIPFPARHLVPYKKYDSILMKRSPVTTIMTSRGCPYKCAFCDRPFLMNKFRARSAANVVDELEVCQGMGIHEFLLYDDTFTVNKQRVIDICDEIINRKMDIGFDIRARVDTVNTEVLEHLKRAGCLGIHYGVEAGTDKILKVLDKGITINQVEEVFDLTKKHRIPILAYFIIGNPTETFEDIKSTFKLMKDLNPDYLHLSILIPFPGTKIYRDGVESGILKSDYWRAFARDPCAGFLPPHWEECFTREELNDLLIRGYKEFYLRPSYIIRRTMRLKTLEELKKKIRAGLKVVGMKKF